LRKKKLVASSNLKILKIQIYTIENDSVKKIPLKMILFIFLMASSQELILTA
jgi:hypothetical protein